MGIQGPCVRVGRSYILKMGMPVKIIDMARDLIRLSVFEPDKDIQIQITELRPGKKGPLVIKRRAFALVCLAVKYSNAAKDDKDLRFKFKHKLIRLMYEKGSGREEILALFEFIDGALDLHDKVLDKKIMEEIEQIEEEDAMPYVTSVERLGIEKGMEKGMEKGELIGGIRVAQLMKGLPMSDKKELEKLSIDDLKNKLQALTRG